MSGALPLPEPLRERARAHLATPGPEAPARLAATVVLLRETPGGPEAYLLRRHAGMAFAAGMYAFPGGAVDPRDAAAAPPAGWAGPTPDAWAACLGLDDVTARAVVCAAVRETYEESGVLLAGPTRDQVVADTSGGGWERDRIALAGHQVALIDLLARRMLVLRSDLLAPCAHWITPRFEPRRYDTWFFLAALPAGAHARDVSGEADRAVWMRPGDALADAVAGRLAMLPPTAAVLEELAGRTSVAQALAAVRDRPLPAVLPEAALVDGDVRLLLPGEPGYP